VRACAMRLPAGAATLGARGPRAWQRAGACSACSCRGHRRVRAERVQHGRPSGMCPPRSPSALGTARPGELRVRHCCRPPTTAAPASSPQSSCPCPPNAPGRGAGLLGAWRAPGCLGVGGCGGVRSARPALAAPFLFFWGGGGGEKGGELRLWHGLLGRRCGAGARSCTGRLVAARCWPADRPTRPSGFRLSGPGEVPATPNGRIMRLTAAGVGCSGGGTAAPACPCSHSCLGQECNTKRPHPHPRAGCAPSRPRPAGWLPYLLALPAALHSWCTAAHDAHGRGRRQEQRLRQACCLSGRGIAAHAVRVTRTVRPPAEPQRGPAARR